MDRGSVPLALLAANLTPITLSMDNILKIVNNFQIKHKLEEDVPCALYQPKKSPQFEDVFIYDIIKERPLHTLDITTTIPCQHIGTSANLFTEPPAGSGDFR